MKRFFLCTLFKIFVAVALFYNAPSMADPAAAVETTMVKPALGAVIGASLGFLFFEGSFYKQRVLYPENVALNGHAQFRDALFSLIVCAVGPHVLAGGSIPTLVGCFAGVGIGALTYSDT